jgi:hypothetical protein
MGVLFEINRTTTRIMVIATLAAIAISGQTAARDQYGWDKWQLVGSRLPGGGAVLLGEYQTNAQCEAASTAFQNSARFGTRLSWCQGWRKPAPPCMPGGICCIAGVCGTLEDFQRNAKAICLLSDAIENKSLPESIKASSDCMAARIRADRIESAQKANAAAHQKALDARRQLREMGFGRELDAREREHETGTPLR